MVETTSACGEGDSESGRGGGGLQGLDGGSAAAGRRLYEKPLTMVSAVLCYSTQVRL